MKQDLQIPVPEESKTLAPWRLFLGVLVSLLLAGSLYGLDPNRRISQYGHTAWRTQDGFFSTPNALTQTADGYLWIGTMNGLVRFDGVRFVPWVAPQGQSLPDPRITSLLGTRDGSLWIGTIFGLSRLKDGSLLNYSPASSGISNIIEDHTGAIWITRYRVQDGKGPLCRVAGKDLQCYGKADGVPSKYGVALSEDSLGNLWIGANVLSRWRPGSSTVFFEKEMKHLNGEPGVLDIAAGPSGSLWAALEGTGPGLGVRQYVDGKWTSYVVEGFDGALVNGHSVFRDRDATLWIGGETEGLYHIHDGKADHFRSTDGLSGDLVNGIYQDREGDLWVATNGGLDFFRDTPVVNFSMREGLSADDTRSILARTDGSIWTGNLEAVDVFRDGTLSTISARQGLPGKQVTALFEDHAGRVWLGVDKKLVIYEGHQFFEVRRSDGSKFETDDAGFSSITEDVDQNIWVVTDSHHLFRVKDRVVREDIPLNGVQAATWLAADQKAGIWIGGHNGQLARYRDGHFEIISLAHGSNSFRVRDIFVDSDNSVWAATTGGIFRWKDGRLSVLNSRNGLPCDSMFSVVKSKDGSFWLYTQCGLLRISEPEMAGWGEQPGKRVAVEIFGPLDAAQPGTAGAQPKVSRSPDGRLWSVNGILVQMIDPGRLYRNNAPPPVHIEEIVADQKSYQPEEHLRLPPLIRNLEINYTALSFPVPSRVRFRYKLEGYDVGWQDPHTRRQAFYTDLRPGAYTFRVMASNNDGVWSNTGATLAFSIAPAWHQTKWFYILCIAFVLWIAWATHRLRVRQVAKTISARFDERLGERTRVARELHDTLLQTIQASKLVADDALDAPKDPANMHRALERLSNWLGQAMQEGRTALNSLRTSTTQKNDLADAFQQEIDSCPVGNSDLTFSVAGVAVEMHPIVREEIYRIGCEAIRNACQHADARHVRVMLSYGQDLSFSVHDDGKGLTDEIAATGRDGHFGLKGMRERAARIDSRLTISSAVNLGTRIDLRVPGNIIFRSPRSTLSTLVGRLKNFFGEKASSPPASGL